MSQNPTFFRMRGLKLDGVRCVSCENPLGEDQAVWGYPHEGGVEVGGRRLWLYVMCRRCGYQNSWRKLGLDTDLHGLGVEVEEVWGTV